MSKAKPQPCAVAAALSTELPKQAPQGCFGRIGVEGAICMGGSWLLVLIQIPGEVLQVGRVSSGNAVSSPLSGAG